MTGPFHNNYYESHNHLIFVLSALFYLIVVPFFRLPVVNICAIFPYYSEYFTLNASYAIRLDEKIYIERFKSCKCIFEDENYFY